MALVACTDAGVGTGVGVSNVVTPVPAEPARKQLALPQPDPNFAREEQRPEEVAEGFGSTW